MLTKQKVVIAGGGFAGINLALKLSNKTGFHVTLVDKNNYNFFPPLLYQVATGFLEVSSISYPFRKLFQKKKNISFRLGELREVVPEKNKILLSNGELFYDYLVIATGADVNYFGSENIRNNALPMKTIDDALDIRNYILQMLEEATIADNAAEKEKLSTIVIAGGGPTGVEIAGMLAEMRRHWMKKDYPEMTMENIDIYLISGSAELLSPMSVSSQKDTFKALIKMGVKIKLNAHVKDFANDLVMLDDGAIIKTKSLIWAAGVIPKVIAGMPAGSYGRGNRLLVDAFNKVKSSDNIFAIGDASLQTTDAKFATGLPQLAQVAIQQGKNLAHNLLAHSKNKPWKPFAYFDKGTMAIIGINKAVLDIPKPKLHLKGFIAFIAWLFIHLVYLVNYRNRMKTFFTWIMAYLTRDQSLRMIIRPSVKVISKKKVTATAALVALN